MSFIKFLINESKPDYIDADGDGDKKEPMKKALKDKKSKKKVKENNMGDYFGNADDEFDRRPQENMCPDCEGSGQDHATGGECQTCDGEGKIYEGIHHMNSAPHLNRAKREDSHKSKSKGAKRHGDSHVQAGTSNRSKVGNYLRNRGRADESAPSLIDYLLNEKEIKMKLKEMYGRGRPNGDNEKEIKMKLKEVYGRGRPNGDNVTKTFYVEIGDMEIELIGHYMYNDGNVGFGVGHGKSPYSPQFEIDGITVGKAFELGGRRYKEGEHVDIEDFARHMDPQDVKHLEDQLEDGPDRNIPWNGDLDDGDHRY